MHVCMRGHECLGKNIRRALPLCVGDVVWVGKNEIPNASARLEAIALRSLPALHTRQSCAQVHASTHLHEEPTARGSEPTQGPSFASRSKDRKTSCSVFSGDATTDATDAADATVTLDGNSLATGFSGTIAGPLTTGKCFCTDDVDMMVGVGEKKNWAPAAKKIFSPKKKFKRSLTRHGLRSAALR
jgi:hypothetical protein